MHTPEQLRARKLAEDWHEGVPKEQQFAWACKAAGSLLLLSSAQADALASPPPAEPAEPGELPPLPAKRWAMYCTKCRYSGGIERPTEKCAACPKCGYCGFAQELDYSSDEMRAYARLALATSPLPRERGEKIMDAALAWRTASYVEREAAEASLRAILEGRA